MNIVKAKLIGFKVLALGYRSGQFFVRTVHLETGEIFDTQGMTASEAHDDFMKKRRELLRKTLVQKGEKK